MQERASQSRHPEVCVLGMDLRFSRAGVQLVSPADVTDVTSGTSYRAPILANVNGETPSRGKEHVRRVEAGTTLSGLDGSERSGVLG